MDERDRLLAPQAYLFNRQHHGHVLNHVDNALRNVLSTPYFSHILRHEEPVTSVALSPDGHRLASASIDTVVRLWDLRQPAASPIVLSGHAEQVTAVAFSPDGQHLASGSAGTTVRLWDLGQPKALPTVVTNGARD
jgi:WD40 repeat protein